MTAHKPNPDDEAKSEAAATATAAAPDQDPSATPSTTPADDAEAELDDKTEQAAAPETEPPSSKKSDKTTRAKRAKVGKDPGAKPRRKQGPQEDAAKATGADSPDGTPNLRTLTIAPEVVPPLPADILPPVIDKLFPNAATRAAPVCALLAATAAAAGHAVGLATGKGDEHGGGLGLRVAVVSDEHSLSSVMAPVLMSAYAVQADETKDWIAEKEQEAGAAAVTTFRQRLFRQTVTNAAMLGLDLTDSSVIPTAKPAVPAARPCFVLRDPVPTAVKQALATANKCALIVDGIKLPTMAGWGTNYLGDLANLLNHAHAGGLLELADPLAHGAIRMRGAHVSVIGVLSTVETFGLYKARATALASTVFVPVKVSPKTVVAGAAKALTAMLARLRALQPEDEGKLRRLRLSADARKLLEQMKRQLMRAATNVLPPLATVYADATDLAVRVAALLHLVGHGIGDADQLPLDIGKDVMVRAVAFVEQYALPAARHVLGPSSIDPVQRNARRVLSFAQQNLSADDPLVLNDVARRLVNTMNRGEIRQAIRLLVDDGLLALKTPAGSQAYIVESLVFTPENRLPNLAGDPRRPKH